MLGCDSADGSFVGHTDSIVIVCLNSNADEYKLISICRDILVPASIYSSPIKLSYICLYNTPDRLLEIIEECFDIELHGYILVPLEQMATIVDIVGGVDIDISEQERQAINKGLFDLSPYSDMSNVKSSGSNTRLNGNQAVAYARIRIIDSDNHRMIRLRKLFTALLKKAQSMSPSDILQCIDLITDSVQTNIHINELLEYCKGFLFDPLQENIQLIIPIPDTYSDEMIGGISYVSPDYKQNAIAIHNFIYN